MAAFCSAGTTMIAPPLRTMGYPMAKDFDWSDPDLKVQRGYGDLAIYANNRGDIVIRQASALRDDEDSFVVIPRHLASWAVAAIEAEMKLVHDDIQSGRAAGDQE
jgi:hypothetical protein